MFEAPAIGFTHPGGGWRSWEVETYIPSPGSPFSFRCISSKPRSCQCVHFFASDLPSTELQAWCNHLIQITHNLLNIETPTNNGTSRSERGHRFGHAYSVDLYNTCACIIQKAPLARLPDTPLVHQRLLSGRGGTNIVIPYLVRLYLLCKTN